MLRSRNRILDKHTIIDTFCSIWTSHHISHLRLCLRCDQDVTLLWEIHSRKTNQWYCLSFFELRLLTTSLVYSNFSYENRQNIDFLPSSQDSNVYLRNLHTFIRPTQWTHLVKRLHMCEIVCWRKCTWHKQNMIRPKKDTKLCLRVEKWSTV
jgi:hypothetical protein